MDDGNFSNNELSDRRLARSGSPQRYAVSRFGMISTAHYLATEAGCEVLEEGGNAIDAAVAAAFALGVCEPQASGLGGQTMMLVFMKRPRKTVALDGSSRAPNRVVPGVLSREDRLRGHRASTVPSTPAVLDYIRARYGTMPLSRLLEPAIRIAREGFYVSSLQRRLMVRNLTRLRSGTAARHLLRGGSEPFAVGELLRQPRLAETLGRIASEGVVDFYHGAIARAIHEDMCRNGGLIHLDDLAQIPWPIERRTLSATFDGRRVVTFPPPGAGRTLIEMLNIYSQLPASCRNLDSPEGALVLAEVIRRALIDRNDRPFDPNVYPQVKYKKMLSTEYGKQVAEEIQAKQRSSGETTHLSVMDRFGNAVSLTQSIERVFGSFEASPELGFLYNNYMSAFEDTDMSHPYYLRPNAAPWASVAPTIVFQARTPWAVIGSPGSDRITPSILQVMLRLDRQSPMEAVASPRLHYSLDGVAHLEAARMRGDIPDYLKRRGYSVRTRTPFSFYLGCVQLALREQHEFAGVADLRRDGSAKGPSV